ncbi:MAG: mRNA-decapping enzyme subunit 2 [Geoglossum simile]|nr:MAG: mRNA-decapping enzyme subunit 2 [Geoglossum simile]
MTEAKMRLEDWLDDLCVRFIINLPQEELESVERICFQVEEAQWFYEDFIRPLDPNLPSLNLKQFSLRIFQHCPLFSEFSPYHHTQAFSEFLSYKTRVPVRGAIMLNDGMDEVVLVKGWKKGANWSFPRGKINKDEKDLDCAIREVYEETGFDARQAGVVPEDSEAKFIEVTMREQNMRLYVFRGIPTDTDFQPRTRKEISKIQWHRLSELPTFKKSKQNQNDKDSDTLALNANKFYMVAPFLKPLKTWIAAQKKLDVKKVSAPKHLVPIVQAEELMTEEELVTENEAGEAKGNLLALLGLPKKVEEPSNLPEVSDVDVSMKDTSARLKRLLSVSESSGPVRDQISDSNISKSNDLLALLQKGLGSSASGEPEPTGAPQPPSELSSSLTPNQPPLNANTTTPSSFPILSPHSKNPQNENSFPQPVAQPSLQPHPSNIGHEQYYHYPPRSFPPQTSYFQSRMSQVPSFVPAQQPLYNSLPSRNPIPQHVGPQQFSHPLSYPHQQTYEIARSPVGSQFSKAHPPTLPGRGVTPGKLNGHSQALLNVLKHGNATELSATPSALPSSAAGQRRGNGSNGVVSPVLNASPAGVLKPRNEHQNALLNLFRSPPTETASPPHCQPTERNHPVELSAHLSPELSNQNFSSTAQQNEISDGTSQNQVSVLQNHKSPPHLKPVPNGPPPTKMSVPSTRPRFEGPTRKPKGKKAAETGTKGQWIDTPPVSLDAQIADGDSQENGTHLTAVPFQTMSNTAPPRTVQDRPGGAMPATFQPQILHRPTRPALPALKTPQAFDRRSSQSAQQTQTLLSLFGKASTPPVSASTNAPSSTSAAGGTTNSIPAPSNSNRDAGLDVKSPIDKKSRFLVGTPSSISDVDKGFLLGYLEDVARSSRRY